MPKSVSTRSAYKMLTCIYLCRTLLFFAPYADFFMIQLLKMMILEGDKKAKLCLTLKGFHDAFKNK